MSYNVCTYPPFDRAIKRLNKRYKSLKTDLLKLIAELQENPQMGADLGKGFRKVRMQISAKGKGKSGGARVITCMICVSEADAAIALVYIYDKSEKGNITDAELRALQEECGL